MSNNSDYKKPRINLFERLPNVLRSDVNRSLMENLFNRFLTKQETRKVAGYIGEGNPNAVVKRQIQEFNIHRQGYQLQPLLYNKIGSVEWMSSWYDILNEAERLGVDRELMQDWLNLLKFNWAPPIDLDKLIHYQDYYWVDEENPTSRPQYITIRSRCSTATSKANFEQNLVDEFGETIPTARAVSVDNTLPTFDIININSPVDTVVVTGDATNDLSIGQYFNVGGTFSNNGVYQVAGVLSYDSGNDRTTIPINSIASPPIVESVGTVTPRRFDKFVILGEYIRLFDPGFVFFYRGSTNPELESSFWQVVDSSYDESANETTVQINTVFTDNTVDGVISLSERLASALADRDCQCSGSIGWDLLQWDDNPFDPKWNLDHIDDPVERAQKLAERGFTDHDSLIAAISNAGAPPFPIGSPNPYVDGELWYDTDDDKLYQFSMSAFDAGQNPWTLIWGNFSLILAETTGQSFWDFTPGCGVSSVITGADQWITENKWLHKSDVANFSVARQAALPIIEYEWDLELNEWTYTPHNWAYRAESYLPWEEVDQDPELIELIPIVYFGKQNDRTFRLDERYGDLTGYFTPGKKFLIQGASQLFEVEYSFYSEGIEGRPAKTRIVVTEDIDEVALNAEDIFLGNPSMDATPASPTYDSVSGDPVPLRPIYTSRGDPWKGLDVHWGYVGAGETFPVVHQPQNKYNEIDPTSTPVSHTSGDYDYTYTYGAQEATIQTTSGVTVIELVCGELPATDRTLRQRALLGFNDVRVYVNDIRQYGTYDELSEDELVTSYGGTGCGSPLDTQYVAGIRFLPGFELSKFDVVRIEVGEATPSNIGLSSIPVMMTDGSFETISLLQYRKEEQVKSETNQYPLFDMYRVDGTPAYMASPLFGFLTDPDADINFAVNLRLATDANDLDYMFQQYLVEDDGTMYAYRDYANHTNDIWVNPETEQVFFWDGFAWSTKTWVDRRYTPAIISNTTPGAPWDSAEADGAYWYDTLTRTLKQGSWNGLTSTVDWIEVPALYSADDPTLQSIWKKGLNDETYVPEKRDWERRSLEEYNEQKEVFVTELAEEYVNSGMTETEALLQATNDWQTKQSNHLSLNGDWVGDWEIPDPLYYNVSHENRQTLSYRELLTHFTTIIESQPKIPGFNGPLDNMYHLIPSNEVNFGLGGTIREYNHGFDTFLSSLFINSVSPRALFEFAHDQYEALVNNLKELYRKEANDLFLDTTTDSLVDLSGFITAAVIEAHEQNDNLALLYGDSSTFTEVDGINDIGIRNWIATLPYIEVLRRLRPATIIDSTRGINGIVHHDGHINNYVLAPAVIEGIVRSVVDAPDPRTNFPGPNDPPTDTYGRISTSLPPNDVTEFESEFNTVIYNREGVYWYTVNGTERTLYRLTVADIGDDEPSSSLPDGTLWLDMTSGLEVLRIKQSDPNDWVPVDGLSPGTSPIRFHNGTDPSDLTTATVSAWQRVDLNEILLDIVLDVEQRLYDNAPDPFQLAYDFDALRAQFPTLFDQKMEEAFLSYVNQSEITAPYANDDYTASDAFTWNYKYSIINQFPSSSNTGTESGGDWRDLYQKLYGTPYPHLEPWKIQGYTDKPTWWDEEYLNDDISKWGNRRWKYKHGFEIVGVDNASDYFEIVGDFEEVFTSGTEFTIDRADTSHNGLWIVDTASYNSITNRTRIFIDTFSTTPLWNVSTSYIVGDVVRYGTNLFEALQASTGETPAVGSVFWEFKGQTDITVNTIEGRITTAYGMWENIRIGVIPPLREYPNGIVSVTGDPQEDSVEELRTSDYFSVNISNDTITTPGTYAPDDVFPPYWNRSEYFISVIGSGTPAPFDYPLRSVFSTFSSISTPGATYVFGDAGPVEWVWRNSSQYYYDLISVAFQIDPVRLTFSIFGTDYHTIGGLFINKRTEQVLSHTDTVFHGDFVDNAPIDINGSNQWYVNFGRYIGLDISMSDFRSMWTLWTTPLGYQFSSFIDTPSFNLAHRYICISEFDYNITSKRSPGTEDFWLDSFEVSFLNIPPKIARYDNDLDWEVELKTRSVAGNAIQYYDVRNYQFHADPDTDTCTLYTWPIITADTVNDRVTIRGDQTHIFSEGRIVEISNSTGNDGSYTVIFSTYNQVENTTIVELEESITSLVADGVLTASYRTLPWTTGDRVTLTTAETLPVPLQGDNVNGVYEYFVVVLDSTRFRLATTRQQALNGQYVDITSSGRGSHYVGQISTTFTTSRTDKFWRHYVIDRTNVLEFTPPQDVRGLQTVVNIIDGYDAFTKDQGWRVNSDQSLRDFDDTSRFVSWQLELERMINYGAGLRDTRRRLTDRFEVTVDLTTDVWTFQGEGRPQLITGDPVTILASSHLYPAPLQHGLRYYMIRDSISEFRLAATRADAQAGVAIDITDLTGVGQLFVTAASNLRQERPKFEIDPFRDGIWFRPERGIVSNLLTGPVEDVYNTQLLLDQYSRPIGRNNIRVFREDKETTLRLKDNILNDVELTSIYNDPYNFIHLASVHLFVDTYEHVLLFNNETTEGQLLYDPFIGLNVSKFETLFNRQLEFTQRPNVGGQFLSTTYNQGADLKRNIEASVEDLRLLYDTYQVIETNPLVEYGRKSLGYEGRQDYLDNLNLSAKSQFAFWRGQIQAKGSINSVEAFVNSRRFIDAKVDEYWAVKVADFGSAREKEYISMWVTTTDARSNDLRLQFVSDEDLCQAGYSTNNFDKSSCGYAYPNSGDAVLVGDPGFEPITLADTDRWFDQPDQLEKLRDNGGVLYFDLKPMSKVSIVVADEFTGSPVEPVLFRHNTKSDFLTVTLNWYEEGHKYTTSVPAGSPVIDVRELTLPAGYEYIPLADSIRVFKDGILLQKDEDYSEVLVGGQLLSNQILFKEGIQGSVIDVAYKTSSLLDVLHFTRINSNIVRFEFPELVTAARSDLTMDIWGWTVDSGAQNPAKIIDKKSDTAITPIQIWDPARGLHYYNGVHVVDLQRDTDPAIYNNTPIVNQTVASVDPYVVYPISWNKQEVGTTWLDTTNLDFLPYYDVAVTDNIDDRSRLWGSLADWGEYKIRTWVESDVPPAEWNALAEQEEGDASITESERKAGRIYETLFEKDGGDWVVAKPKFDEFDVLFEGIEVGTNTYTFQLINTLKYGSGSPIEYLPVEVYVNGQLRESGVIPSPIGEIVVDNLRDVDRVRFVLPVPTDEDYIAAEIEAGNLLREYQYTTDTYYDSLGTQRTMYYFWVEDKATRSGRTISPREAQETMEQIPIPYMFFQGVRDQFETTFGDVPVTLPIRFTQVIIRGLRGLIDDDFRYVIRWTRDFTLRDTLDTGRTPLENKNLHEQWELIRREQPNHIPQWLWTRITEAIVGYKLDDPSTRVPSYERELYDTENETGTRIGLGNGQAIADGELALATILADLNNPDNDFAPVDINVFFQNHSFDTPENIISAMTTIYNTFPFIHVNRMFFDVLLDGLSQQDKYADIFKTSMVALHGIRPFQVAGVFDD